MCIPTGHVHSGMNGRVRGHDYLWGRDNPGDARRSGKRVRIVAEVAREVPPYPLIRDRIRNGGEVPRTQDTRPCQHDVNPEGGRGEDKDVSRAPG